MNLTLGYKLKPITLVANNLADFKKAVEIINIVASQPKAAYIPKPTSTYYKKLNATL